MVPLLLACQEPKNYELPLGPAAKESELVYSDRNPVAPEEVV